MKTVIALLALAVGLGALAADAAPKEPEMPKEATIYTVVVKNYWETNCYIIAGKTGQAIVFDPGDSMDMANWEKDDYQVTGETARAIEKLCIDRKLTLKYIVLSHGHLDHIGAAGYLKEKTGAKLLMHEGDVRTVEPFIGCPKDARMFAAGVLPKVDRTLADGEMLELDGMSFRVIHTPGHSPGGICLFTHQAGRPILLSGDTLLYHSLGRTNFKDGSGNQDLLYKNIREKLFTLPEDTFVLTGHYQFTTIGEEKANNPFINPPADIFGPADPPEIYGPVKPPTPDPAE
jgi:glyoxylase-like metal-dependent hydrolase (beta-lactamase superfamily II)